MKKIHLTLLRLAAASSLAFPALAFARGLEPLRLPEPDTKGGKSLMQALKERRSAREFSREKLPLQTLSNLLWAAFGVNRPDSGKRTAPSAMDHREIDVYVATAEGLYLFDAEARLLKPVSDEDLRALTGRQDYVAQAPVNLVYVANASKAGSRAADSADFYAAADTGFIAENVYLYCASAGLACVARGSIDRETLAKAMKLRPEQKITLAQSVGLPAKSPP